MSKRTQSSKRNVEQTDAPRMLPVNKDSSFVRISADDIIVVHRKRDVLISLIANGPEPIEQALHGRPENGAAVQKVHLKQSFTEIARVGLPAAIAFNMAMNIIEAAVQNRNVPIEQFRVRFLAMLDEHDTPNEKDTKAAENFEQKR